METIPMTTEQLFPIIAGLGFMTLGWIGMYVQEIIDGQRPNPFSQKTERTQDEN